MNPNVEIGDVIDVPQEDGTILRITVTGKTVTEEGYIIIQATQEIIQKGGM